MRCYACGSELTEQDFCTACGADVSQYKRIRYMSARLYNEGLDRARVRDLSGAASCLKQSIRLYKGNIDARNLLGLVYYETGEVVAALTEWVISKNLRENRNLAGHLLDEVQKEPQRLETLGQTAKKFNLALSYAEQENYDLSVIQLKRILQLNPGFVRARQLLALLYLRAGEYERAKLECNRCLRIDSGNTMAKRYLKEAQLSLAPSEQKKVRRGDDTVRYTSGNETIIQPSRGTIHGGTVSVFLAIAGLAVGIAVSWFFILPTRVSRIQQAFRQEIASVSEESDAKSVQIRNLEQEIASMKERVTEAEAQAQAAGEVRGHQSVDALMQAVSQYLSDPEDMDAVRRVMAEVEKSAPDIQEDAGAVQLYDSFAAVVGTELAETFYNEGYEAWRSEDDAAAIKALKRACELDPENEDALFYLGRACYRSGDMDGARDALEKLIDKFPDSRRASEAQDIIAEMNNTDI